VEQILEQLGEKGRHFVVWGDIKGFDPLTREHLDRALRLPSGNRRTILAGMPGPYDQLITQLENQLERTARFVAMAFHIHSPESFDWAKRPGADVTRNDRTRLLTDPEGVREYLDNLAREFSIVCVTDHMKSAYACRLAEEARQRDDITVFPGVELNCIGAQLGSSRIHLLAVFPSDANPGRIDRICAVHRPGSFPAERDRQGNEELQVESLKELAEAIHHEDGLFILAHIDEHQRGHRARFRVAREESLGFERTAVGSDAPLEVQQQVSAEYGSYVGELAPDAIEIMNPEARQHYVTLTVRDKRKRIPCVIRSDHHSIEEFAREEAKTYVKVARHDFDSVREALQFFETRVRYSDDLPATPSPRIVGLRLRSPTRGGLFENATVAFNPNLNCVIGSRGSGKSTIVEALRYALGLNRALTEIPMSGDGQVNFAEIALRTQRANLKDTLIEVVFEIEGARQVLSATFDAEAAFTTSTFPGNHP
jgi:hypothetical protein